MRKGGFNSSRSRERQNDDEHIGRPQAILGHPATLKPWFMGLLGSWGTEPDSWLFASGGSRAP
jgi:hypothetical protein